MISYSTNWMGPISLDWIKTHGDHWAGGRIDVYGTGDDYPNELALPTMHEDDWQTFSAWLELFETEKMYTLDQLIVEYEKTHPPIRWHKERNT
jgi:hypothetical protein